TVRLAALAIELAILVADRAAAAGARVDRAQARPAAATQASRGQHGAIELRIAAALLPGAGWKAAASWRSVVLAGAARPLYAAQLAIVVGDIAGALHELHAGMLHPALAIRAFGVQLHLAARAVDIGVVAALLIAARRELRRRGRP